MTEGGNFDDGFLCDDNKQMSFIYYDCILPSVYGVALISMIPPLYIYIDAFIKKKLKTTKLLFSAGLILFIITYIEYIGLTAWTLRLCHNPMLYRQLQIPITVLFSLQTIILLQILFFRLYQVFNNTAYALHKCTIITWIIYFTFVSIMYLFGSVCFTMKEFYALGIQLLLGSITFAGIAMVVLVAMFCYKLVKVHHSVTSDGENKLHTKLVNAITKNAVLCFVSLSVNLVLNFGIHPMLSLQPSIHLDFVMRLFGIADLYTNYMAVLLSYSYFDQSYQRLCRHCHSCCYCLWNGCFRRQQKPRSNVTKMTVMVKSGSATPTSDTEMNETEVVFG